MNNRQVLISVVSLCGDTLSNVQAKRKCIDITSSNNNNKKDTDKQAYSFYNVSFEGRSDDSAFRQLDHE